MRIYLSWWREMIKRWWWFVGLVGAIQIAWWFVPSTAQKYEILVRAVSVAILVLPLLIWIPYTIWKEARPEVIRDHHKNPNSYIHLHLCSIDLSAIAVRRNVQNEPIESMGIKFCFCNALFHEVKLMSLSGKALINNKETSIFARQESIEVRRGFTSLVGDLSFTSEMLLAVGMITRPNIKVDLSLVAYDDNNHEYKWDTSYDGPA